MLSIRPATVDDAALLAAMIREFAEFEHLEHEVSTTEEDLVRDGFGPQPKFRSVIAEWDGEPVGYAIFFEFYLFVSGARRTCFWTTFLCGPPFASTASARR